MSEREFLELIRRFLEEGPYSVKSLMEPAQFKLLRGEDMLVMLRNPDAATWVSILSQLQAMLALDHAAVVLMHQVALVVETSEFTSSALYRLLDGMAQWQFFAHAQLPLVYEDGEVFWSYWKSLRQPLLSLLGQRDIIVDSYGNRANKTLNLESPAAKDAWREYLRRALRLHETMFAKANSAAYAAEEHWNEAFGLKSESK